MVVILDGKSLRLGKQVWVWLVLLAASLVRKRTPYELVAESGKFSIEMSELTFNLQKGGLINGYFASKYGYRWVMIIALGFINVFIFVVVFATGDGMLLAGEFLCGLSWGVFATLAPAYGKFQFETCL